MSGAHNLGIGKINKDLKGEAYLKAVNDEMNEKAVNQGVEESSEEK